MSETARGGTRYYGTSLAIYHVTSPMGQLSCLKKSDGVRRNVLYIALFQTKLVPVFDSIYQFLIVIHLLLVIVKPAA